MSDDRVTVREIVDPDDWPGVAEVFNYFVERSPAAYPDQPIAPEYFARIHASAPRHPFLVVECDQGIVGFAYLSPYHPARTIRRTAMLTYFILPPWTGRGLGSILLERLIAVGREMGITNFLAHISSLNEGSVRFHRHHQFSECGRFRSVGRKMGKEFDIVWMQRREE